MIKRITFFAIINDDIKY